MSSGMLNLPYLLIKFDLSKLAVFVVGVGEPVKLFIDKKACTNQNRVIYLFNINLVQKYTNNI